eukprot:scaffold35682_cov60-Phaeocystis_antarctica.AAC.5
MIVRVGIRPTEPVFARNSRSSVCDSSRAIWSGDLKLFSSRSALTVCQPLPPSDILYIRVSCTTLPQIEHSPFA